MNRVSLKSSFRDKQFLSVSVFSCNTSPTILMSSPGRQTSSDFENYLTQVFFQQNANLYQVLTKAENVEFFTPY